jgi:putative DNA-invertase from lambdoid prophage Rac
MFADGAGTSAIAKATGLTRQAVLRIGPDIAKAEAALVRWTEE